MYRKPTGTAFGTVLGTLAVLVPLLLAVHCERSNPFDAKGTKFIAGDIPHATFAKDTLLTYINDTVFVGFSWSDSATGGGAGAVEWIYLSWDGDHIFEDSVRGGGGARTDTIARVFTADTARYVYLQPIDDEGNRGRIDSVWLEVVLGRPTIEAVVEPGTVAEGSPTALWVSAQDPNGRIVEYRWALDGVTYETVTTDSAIERVFTDTGELRILVKAVDDDGVPSDPATILLTVTRGLVDTVGPAIQFLLPESGDTVHAPRTAVYLYVRDTGGVREVRVDTAEAALDGETWRCNVDLTEGSNKLLATAVDGAGNLSARTLSIYYLPGTGDKDPPQISFIDPAAGDTVVSSSFDVIVRVLDQSEVSQVTIDSVAADTLGNNRYRGRATVGEGADTIAVTATDSRGNTARDSLIVYHDPAQVDTAPPTLTVSKPAELQRIPANSIEVAGQAYDPSRLSAVRVNGLPATVDYPSWSAVVTLEHGYDTIIVTAVDSSAARNRTHDTVVVIQNAPPIFEDTGSELDTTIVVGTAYAVTVSASDPDGDGVSFRLLGADGLEHTSTAPVTTSEGGRVTVRNYTAATPGVDTLRLQVRDTLRDADTLTWHIYVASADDHRPFFTVDPGDLPASAVVGSTYAVTLSAKDPDADQLRFGLLSPPTPAGAGVDALTGALSWVPAVGDTGRDSLLATVTDGTHRDTLGWGVTVSMYNRPPVLINPGDRAAKSGEELAFALSASDPDVDALEFAFGASLPVGAVLDSNRFSWTPAAEDAGSHEVTFVVRERDRQPALADTESVIITVSVDNRHPRLEDPGDRTVDEGSELRITLSAVDEDGDGLVYGVLGKPAGSELVDSVFTWTPTHEQAGVYPVTFTVADNGSPSLSDSVSVSITVRDVNRAPVFSTTADSMTKLVHLGSPYRDTVAAADPDDEAVTYGILNAPQGFVIDAAGGVVTWTPTAENGLLPDAGLGAATVPVGVTAADPQALADTLAWSIAVLPKWPKYYGDEGDDLGRGVVSAGDGGFVVCGTVSAGAGRGRDIVVLKTDSLGHAEWYCTFGGAGEDAGHGIARASGGGYVVCGTVTPVPGNTDAFAAKVGENGDTVWTYTYDGGADDGAHGVTASADGGVVVCGFTGVSYSAEGKMHYDALLLGLGSGGGELWRRTYHRGFVDIAYSVAAAPDGGYVLCGSTTPQRLDRADSADVYIVRTDAGGDTMWTRAVAGSGTNVGYSVAATSGDGFVVCGAASSTSGSTGLDLWLGMVSSSGSVVWDVAYGGLGTDVGYGVVETGQGHFVGCGATNSVGLGGYDAYFVEVDHAGNPIGGNTVGDSGDDVARGLAVIPDGGFVVTGGSQVGGEGDTDITLLKIDASLRVER